MYMFTGRVSAQHGFQFLMLEWLSVSKIKCDFYAPVASALAFAILPVHRFAFDIPFVLCFTGSSV